MSVSEAAAAPLMKIVLVGDARVGKSCLLTSWAHSTSSQDFSDSYEPTISPELTTKEVTWRRADGGKQAMRLQVWDMGFGEQEAASHFPVFVQGASAAVLLYDCTHPTSVDGVLHWHEQVKSVAGSDLLFAVVACKSDLQSAPGLVAKAKSFAESIKAIHVSTSAKQPSAGDDSLTVFESLARQLYAQRTGAQNHPLISAQNDSPAAEDSTTAKTAPVPVVKAQQPVAQQPQPEFPAPPEVKAQPAGSPLTLPGICKEDGSPTRRSMPSPRKSLPSDRQSFGLGGGNGDSPEVRVKLVLLGPPGVGKTCLAQRLAGVKDQQFQEEYIATPGPEFSTQQVQLHGRSLRVQVWDAAGQDLYENASVCENVLRGTDAALVIYDLTNRDSMAHVLVWMKVLRSYCSHKVAVAMVGNKSDLISRRAIPSAQSKHIADMLRVPSLECSARLDADLPGLLSMLLDKSRAQPNWAALDSINDNSPKAVTGLSGGAAFDPAEETKKALTPTAAAALLADRPLLSNIKAVIEPPNALIPSPSESPTRRSQRSEPSASSSPTAGVLERKAQMSKPNNLDPFRLTDARAPRSSMPSSMPLTADRARVPQHSVSDAQLRTVASAAALQPGGHLPKTAPERDPTPTVHPNPDSQPRGANGRQQSAVPRIAARSPEPVRSPELQARQAPRGLLTKPVTPMMQTPIVNTPTGQASSKLEQSVTDPMANTAPVLAVARAVQAPARVHGGLDTPSVVARPPGGLDTPGPAPGGITGIASSSSQPVAQAVAPSEAQGPRMVVQGGSALMPPGGRQVQPSVLQQNSAVRAVSPSMPHSGPGYAVGQSPGPQPLRQPVLGSQDRMRYATSPMGRPGATSHPPRLGAGPGGGAAYAPGGGPGRGLAGMAPQSKAPPAYGFNATPFRQGGYGR
eukprot:TRINITY_DN6467_c0_g3_i3.p1 TRINITY_DN6467_c0_g3~~TRINITY_DN6467_c0_g3_i3.p1  ORF type:complete len:910 (+),score=111.56 TRINITY_DN6467_c0_g3_i3:223-2952(+)